MICEGNMLVRKKKLYIIKWLDNAYRVVRETRRQETNGFVDITLFFLISDWYSIHFDIVR